MRSGFPLLSISSLITVSDFGNSKLVSVLAKAGRQLIDENPIIKAIPRFFIIYPIPTDFLQNWRTIRD